MMKKLLCAALTAFASATLASCQGGQGDDFKPVLNTETVCTIKVVGDYSNFESLDAECERFNEYYPKVHIEYSKLDNYENILGARLESDGNPNIFVSYPKMINNDAFSAVERHMEDLSDPALGLDLSCIRPNLLNRDGQGKVLMAPIFSRTYGALVNESLFQKEGIAIPTTWSGLWSACEAFRAKGYKSPMMGYTKYDYSKSRDEYKPSNGLMYAVAYPMVVTELSKTPGAIDLANNLDPRAGEYVRPALVKMKKLFDTNCTNLEECDKINDNYVQTLLRFFEGDVPMMACSGDTVSGAKKREKESTPFKSQPFTYAFHPIPMAEEGGYFIDSPSLEFSVNKYCDNLDMTNEFMRFLLRTRELDNIASRKGLITTTKTTPFPSVYYKDPKTSEVTYTPAYNPFNAVPAARTFSPEVIGIKDRLTGQIKAASFYVGRGELSVDEAVAGFGTLPESNPSWRKAS